MWDVQQTNKRREEGKKAGRNDKKAFQVWLSVCIESGVQTGEELGWVDERRKASISCVSSLLLFIVTLVNNSVIVVVVSTWIFVVLWSYETYAPFSYYRPKQSLLLAKINLESTWQRYENILSQVAQQVAVGRLTTVIWLGIPPDVLDVTSLTAW